MGIPFVAGRDFDQHDDVVRNTKYYELSEDFQPIAYVPEAQNNQAGTAATFVLRTNAPLGEFYHNATAAAAEIHPEIGVDFTALTAQTQNSLMRDRLMAVLAVVVTGNVVLPPIGSAWRDADDRPQIRKYSGHR